LEASLTDILF